MYFICECLPCNSFTTYHAELIFFKALKSSSKSPQGLELSFFEYIRPQGFRKNVAFLSWLMKQERIFFFLRFIQVCYLYVLQSCDALIFNSYHNLVIPYCFAIPLTNSLPLSHLSHITIRPINIYNLIIQLWYNHRRKHKIILVLVFYLYFLCP